MAKRTARDDSALSAAAPARHAPTAWSAVTVDEPAKDVRGPELNYSA